MIGITSQIESSGNGGGNVGIGFAVPIDTAKQIAQQLIDNGGVAHAFLGISGTDLTPDIADALNLDVDHGALVESVVPGLAGGQGRALGGQRDRVVDGGTGRGRRRRDHRRSTARTSRGWTRSSPRSMPSSPATRSR